MGFLGRLLGLFRRRGPQGVRPREAHRLVEEGALLIDVRRRAERRAGAPAGSKHIPLHALDHRIGKLDPSRPVVCICASGMRSHAAARHLAKAGFEAAYTVDGGFRAWQRAGLP